MSNSEEITTTALEVVASVLSSVEEILPSSSYNGPNHKNEDELLQVRLDNSY